ncbi:MAG: type II toxin-antitoxin system RelB/DinJ family antitoxin [Oscillospiraceae bacterium]|nr:type II toxin-antitoxin system RelB/DinJ family antitoxin [Oscillospiraceae bacterium]
MAKEASLYIGVDEKIKEEAEELYASFGITISEAVKMFLYKSLMVGGIPFDLIQPRYNEETEAAMQEVKDMMEGKIPSEHMTVDEFIKEMEK